MIAVNCKECGKEFKTYPWLFANTKSHVRHHRGLDYPKSDVLFKGGVHKSP